MTDNRLGLALGSGSARGLAHIGVLKVLDREGLPIDMIAGTSMGAFIGGAYAVGVAPAEMERIALSASVQHLFSLVDIARPTTALVNGRKVEAFIREIVGDKTFADTKIPFACVAVDLISEQEVVLREGDLATAIRASISTPIVFAPVVRDEQVLVDGGVSNPVPVDVVRDMGAETVVAVTTSGTSGRRRFDRSNGGSGEHYETGTLRTRGVTQVIYARALTLATNTLGAPTVSQVAFGSIDLMQRRLSEFSIKTADVAIAPIDSARYYGFHEAERIIAAGEMAAEAAVGEIGRLLAERPIALADREGR
jgi:predicted acylesterase/phospholipase RssA